MPSYSNISHIHTNMGLVVVVSCLWYAIIRCRHSRICYFMDIYTIYNHDTIIQTTYVDFQKILTSIIIFIQESNMLLNCIVIAFNNGDYNSCYKFISLCCLSFSHSTMIYLSYIALESIIYDIIQ